MEGFQSAFTLTDRLNGKLLLNELLLVINDKDTILVSHNHNLNPLLQIAIDNQVITSSLSSLSIILPSTLSETVFNLMNTYSPFFSLIPSSETPVVHSDSPPSRNKQILHRIRSSFVSCVEQYFIEASIENCDLSLSAITPTSVDNMQLNLNCAIKLSMNNLTCYSVSFQFYLFTIGLTHQLVDNCAVYYESNNSLIETGLSFSVVYNNNLSDKSRRIRISSSLDEVDLFHIIDTNNTNAIVLNLNTIQDLLSIVTFMMNSFSVFGVTSSPTAARPAKSSSVDSIEVCFPTVVLRYSLYSSIFFFISIENLVCSLRHTAQDNHIQCDFDTSIQYEMNSPLQFLLNKVGMHAEVNMHDNHLIASASVSRRFLRRT